MSLAKSTALKSLAIEALSLCDSIDRMEGVPSFEGGADFTDREKELMQAAAQITMDGVKKFLSKHQAAVRTLAIAYENGDRSMIILPGGDRDGNIIV